MSQLTKHMSGTRCASAAGMSKPQRQASATPRRRTAKKTQPSSTPLAATRKPKRKGGSTVDHSGAADKPARKTPKTARSEKEKASGATQQRGARQKPAAPAPRSKRAPQAAMILRARQLMDIDSRQARLATLAATCGKAVQRTAAQLTDRSRDLLERAKDVVSQTTIGASLFKRFARS